MKQHHCVGAGQGVMAEMMSSILYTEKVSMFRPYVTKKSLDSEDALDRLVEHTSWRVVVFVNKWMFVI